MKTASDREITVLLVEDNPADADWIRETLLDADAAFRVQWAAGLAPALERLRGKHFDLVLLDLMLPDSAGPETFHRLSRRAGDTAIVILSGLQDADLALEAVKQGAQDYLVKGRTPPEILARALRYAVERQRSLIETRALTRTSRQPAELTAFIGAKGGVGTTTVAANVAALLGRQEEVIAAELDGMGAGFTDCFRIPPSVASVWDVEHPDAREISRRLWKLPSGLRVLRGAQVSDNFREVSAEQVDAVLEALSWMARRVIFDAPSRPCSAVCAAMRRANSIVLVVEREPGAVSAARHMLNFLRDVCLAPGLIQAVVVNRVSFACPIALAEIERHLEVPILGVIPPNPDLCVQARRAGSPVAFYQPESALGASLIELAEKLTAGTLAAAQRA